MLLLLTFSSFSPTCVYNTNRVVSKAKLTIWGGCLGFPSTKFVINSIPVGTSYTHPQLSHSLIPSFSLSLFGCCERPWFFKEKSIHIFPTVLYTICSSGAIRGNRFETILGHGGRERRILILKRDSFQIKKGTRQRKRKNKTTLF